MFGKKNKQPDPNLIINQLFADLAVLLYQGVAQDKAGISLNGTLVFDTQQRISELSNVTVDGSPKIPSPDVVETMNILAKDTLTKLPEIYKLKKLELSVQSDGTFGAAPTYAK